MTVYSATDGYIRESGSSFDNSTILVGTTGTAGDFLNGLFSFDLSSVPSGMQIDSISLKLYSAQDDSTSVNTTVTFQIYELLRDFTSAATWAKYSSDANWQIDGAYGVQDRGATLFSSLAWNPKSPSPTRGTAYIFDSSAAFVAAANNALVSDGILNLWLGLDTSATGRHVARLVGSEDPSTLDPRLTITYSPIPEPATIFLLMAGLGLMAFRFRKRIVG